MLEHERLLRSDSRTEPVALVSQLDSLVATYQHVRGSWGRWQLEILERSIFSHTLDLMDFGYGSEALVVVGRLNGNLRTRDENGRENAYLKDFKRDVHTLFRMRRARNVSEGEHQEVYSRVRDRFNIFFCEQPYQFRLQ